MIHFNKLTSKDVPNIGKYLDEQSYRTCDFTEGAIFMWRGLFYSEFAIYKDMLLFKVAYPKRGTSFSFPVGFGSVDEAMEGLEEYVRENKIPFRLCTMPEKGMEYVKFRYGDKVVFHSNRDWYDYLYKAEDLKYFKGKKFHGQRNHVNRFMREHPNYTYRRITKDNVDDVIRLFDEKFQVNPEAAKSEELEAKSARDYLSHFLSFDHVGGLIEVDGNIIAFAIGEIIKDTLYVHVERALTEYHGAYQMIVSEFAKDYATDGVLFINREDDVGDPGLRTSKLSYRPISLLEKYCADIELV